MPPPLPPSQLGFAFGPRPPIQVELFLDFVCPFSTKMWTTVVNEVLPKVGEKVTVVVHQVVQPWHPTGTMVHEVALAVKEAAPTLYVAFVSKFCEEYAKGRFKDEDAWHKTRAQIYEELIEIATSVGVDSKRISPLVALKPEGGNAGNAMTQHVKVRRLPWRGEVPASQVGAARRSGPPSTTGRAAST